MEGGAGSGAVSAQDDEELSAAAAEEEGEEEGRLGDGGCWGDSGGVEGDEVESGEIGRGSSIAATGGGGGGSSSSDGGFHGLGSAGAAGGECGGDDVALGSAPSETLWEPRRGRGGGGTEPVGVVAAAEAAPASEWERESTGAETVDDTESLLLWRMRSSKEGRVWRRGRSPGCMQGGPAKACWNLFFLQRCA